MSYVSKEVGQVLAKRIEELDTRSLRLRYQLSAAEARNAADTFLHAFITREPLAHELYLVNPQAVTEAMEELTRELVTVGNASRLSSFVLTPKGTIASLVLTEPLVSGAKEFPEPLAPIGELLNDLDAQLTKYLLTNPGERRICEIPIMVVSDAYQGLQLCRLMTITSMCKAALDGYTHVVVKTTSNSQIVLDRMEFETIGEARFADYPAFREAPGRIPGRHRIESAKMQMVEIQAFLTRTMVA